MLSQTLETLFGNFGNAKVTNVSGNNTNPNQLNNSNFPQKTMKQYEELYDDNTFRNRNETCKYISRSVKSNMGYYVFGECSESGIELYDGSTDKDSNFTLFIDCPADKISKQSTEVTSSVDKSVETSLRSKKLVEVRHSIKKTNFRLPKVESFGLSGLRAKEDVHAIGDTYSVHKFQDQFSSHLCVDTEGFLRKKLYKNKLLFQPLPSDEQIFQRCNVKVPKKSDDGSAYPLSSERSDASYPSTPPSGKMDWNDYHRLDVIHDFMNQLEKEYPSLCSTDTIGQSIEGRDIKILKISNSEASNTAVWIDAGIHAREWIAPAVNTYIANYLARNFHTLPECITNKDWYFLPVLNPDGYEYSHTNNRMWRKNRAWHEGECVGVDLNRNFGYGWGGRGSSSKPTHGFYRGPAPFSEPESNAIKEFMMNSGVKFKVYITLHSFGQVIIFPFASSLLLCPDYIRLLQGATVMSKAIYETNGNTYKVGVSKDVMYTASGTSNDWCYASVGIPYCYLIELRSKKHKFILPKEEINETGNEILQSLMALMDFVDNNDSLNIWNEEASTMDVMVEGHRAAQVAGMLHERDIPYSVAIGDIGVMLEKEQCFSKTMRISYNPNRMDWYNYHRLETIYTFMQNLAKEYPSVCTVMVIGRSVEGRDLMVLKVSNGNTSNSGVWLDGAIHPREWISTAVVTYIADTLVKNFNKYPECVTNKDWYILPVLNPDGYEYTHTNDRMWRKNRAKFGECVGVDLNRNFSYGWGEKGEEGSSEDPGNIFHRGPSPFSEPETIAVRHMILDSTTQFKVFLSFHSYGEVIIFPWGYTADPCPDYVELLEGGTAMARAIHETSGHTYKVGSTKDLMYYAAGTSVDWSYGVAGIPYSYMVELRSKKHRFLLPKEEILSTSNEIMNGLLSLTDFVDKRCKGTQSSSD